MPVLSNSRWERFAQALSEGKSAADAYEFAGYNPDRGNAVRLQQNDTIQQRVTVLLEERARIEATATAHAISAKTLTKEWIIENLMENVRRAMQATSVLDDGGNPIGEYTYNGAVANKALELLGRERGMFIERKEVDIYGDLNRMTDGDLMTEVRRRAQALSIDLEPLAIEDKTGE